MDENFKAMFKIFKMIYDSTDLNQNIRKINILFHLVDLLLSKKIEGINIFNICELFAKKCNNTVTMDDISKKMLNDDYLNTVENPKKFI